MRALPFLAMFAAMAMTSDVPPPPEREPIEPGPEPQPDPRCPAPMFRPRGWHPNPNDVPWQRSRAEDLEAIAAARAKRDRKNRKRLQELR